jgi:hypothetical protein
VKEPEEIAGSTPVRAHHSGHHRHTWLDRVQQHHATVVASPSQRACSDPAPRAECGGFCTSVSRVCARQLQHHHRLVLDASAGEHRRAHPAGHDVRAAQPETPLPLRREHRQLSEKIERVLTIKSHARRDQRFIDTKLGEAGQVQVLSGAHTPRG